MFYVAMCRVAVDLPSFSYVMLTLKGDAHEIPEPGPEPLFCPADRRGGVNIKWRCSRDC